MVELPPPGTYKLEGDTPQEGFVQALFLGAIAQDYARMVRRLVSDIIDRVDPYRGGEAEALLAIAGARDVARTAAAVEKMPLLPNFFRDLIRDQRRIFSNTNPHLKAARDVIEHIDEYMFARGRMREHWFDLTSRFGPDVYLLRVGGSLDINMMSLATEAENLARVVAQVVTIWVDIERKMTPVEQMARPLLEAGISVTARFIDSAAEPASSGGANTEQTAT